MQVHVFLNLKNHRTLVGLLREEQSQIYFQYAPDFLTSHLSLSPLSVPNSSRVWYSANDLFIGLPGFIADSLPDGWGNLLLDRQLRKQGRRLDQISPLERLCWVGKQGMGALEYEPATQLEHFEPESIVLDSLANDIQTILEEKESAEALETLSQLNGSSGGARPKIVCLVSNNKKYLKRGSLGDNTWEPWLIKFQHSNDKSDIGIHEYICSLIAKQAGIRMPETHLFVSQRGRSWFGTKRFDRVPNGKIHALTAAGLLHCDYRLPSLDYESLMALTKYLCATSESLKEQLKRCIFNFALGNCDDHAKNFSFLMDETGNWSLSPAYDIVTSEALGGEHMTSLMGKGRDITRNDFFRLGEKFDLTREVVDQCIDEVNSAMSLYTEYARKYNVTVPPSIRLF